MNDETLRTRVGISADPLDPAAAYAEVADDRAGATVLFSGTVRNHSAGKTDIDHLEYEAYAEQVEEKIDEIIAEARREWDVLHVVAEHRTGVVEVRGVSVLVAVSSVHRGAAFDCARYIIDELKKRAPIWKKEHWPGGAEWVEGA